MPTATPTAAPVRARRWSLATATPAPTSTMVDADGVVGHRDRPVALAGEGPDSAWWATRLACTQASAERLALDDLADLGTDEALDAAGQGSGEPAQPVGQLGTNALLGQRVDRLVGQALDVQVGEDLGGDLVGDGGLDGRVGGQRSDRADIAVGVGDLVAGPDRHPSQRRQHTADHDQHHGHDGAPTLPRNWTRAGHAALVPARPGLLVHGETSPG